MSGRSPRPRRSSPNIPVPTRCREMIRRGALIAVNHSGGKDSQAMTLSLSRLVAPEQLVVVHAPLGEVEWPGTIEHIENTIPPGVPLIFAPITSGKSLLEHIEDRGKFPGVRQRFCTSEHKTGPIERELRRCLKAHPGFNGRIVNCPGIRRDKSVTRARRIPWKRNERNSRAGRDWFDWLPIFDLSTDDVFQIIRDAGQSPHWIYDHLSRCSCSFCIFSSRRDLRRAAELRPDLYREYAALEQRIGHTLSPTRLPLPELTGMPAEPIRGPGSDHAPGLDRS